MPTFRIAVLAAAVLLTACSDEPRPPRPTLTEESPCDEGRTLCGVCVDTSLNSYNCGACGNVCPDSGACVAGACTANSYALQPLPPTIESGGYDTWEIGAVALDGELPALVVTGETGTRFVPRVAGGGIGEARTIGPGAVDLELADFDGDGRDDVALALAYEGRVDVVELEGTTRGAAELGGVGAWAIESADLIGDGSIDLIATTRDERILLFEGVGDGTFLAPVELANSLPSWGLAAADLDEDADDDLAIGHAGGIRLLRREGDALLVEELPIEGGGFRVAIADMDGDGREDIVAAAEDIHVLLATDAGFEDLQTVLQIRDVLWTLLITDIDADGRLDVVGGSFFSNSSGVTFEALVLHGNGDGTLQPPTGHLAVGPAMAIWAGDIHGDGAIDLVTGIGPSWGPTSPGGKLTVLAGRGDGWFPTRTAVWVAEDATDATAVDLGADGVVDLVVSDGASSQLRLLRGEGDGRFVPAGSLEAASEPRQVTSADVDADGVRDLLAVHREAGAIGLWKGRADGSFEDRTDVAADPAFDLEVGDFDRDGDLDLASASYVRDVIELRAGNGDGTFGPAAVIDFGDPVVSRIADVTSGDVDGDGWLDLAVSYRSPVTEGGGLFVLRNDGHGGFSAPVRLEHPAGPTEAVLSDFDQDGAIDVAALSYGGAVTIHRNLGDGKFDYAQLYDTNYGDALDVGDFDGDGWVDLAVGGPDPKILLGNGDGSFRELLFDHAATGWSMAVTDVDSDGREDLVAVHRNGHPLTVSRSAKVTP